MLQLRRSAQSAAPSHRWVRQALRGTSGANVATPESRLAERVRATCLAAMTNGGGPGSPVVTSDDATSVLQLAAAVLKERANVQSLTQAECVGATGVTVWGDVHGQGRDVAHMMKTLGAPSASNPMLFNGDLVDRGPNGAEIVLLLCSHIIEEPTSVWINRGNHEVPECYRRYGFSKEVSFKYGGNAGAITRSFQDLFNAASMAHVVDKSVFVVHGGIPKDRAMTIEQLNRLSRFDDEPDAPFYLMLWSDPVETAGRGAPYTAADVKRFLTVNKLSWLLRSHEYVMDGYQYYHGKLTATVFSAPNYCGSVGNKAAVAKFTFGKNGTPEWVDFKASPL